MGTATTPAAEALTSATYRVTYTYERSIFPDSVQTTLGAYSTEDAARRVRESLRFNDGVEILDVVEYADSRTPVACTYNGSEWGINGSAWQFPTSGVDAPSLVCDVHNVPAHGTVYDSETEDGTFHGPCQWHPEPDGGM